MQTGSKILVTGGSGFLGHHVVKRLKDTGHSKVVTPRASEYDLREQSQVRLLLQETEPEVVIHLAAAVGGIGANLNNPGRFLYENAIMGLMLIEEARLAKVRKFVTIGTICSYPKFAPIPFKETDLWNGYPEETNAPYGLAKKLLLTQSQSYREQYGFNAIYLMPVNLYGPNDHFDLQDSHVIPALIRKCCDAVENGTKVIELWGDGTPTREFLYVEEAARAIVLAAEKYNGSEPVNIGTGREISIRDLATLIADLTGFKGELRWDSSKPNGQPRRCLDVQLAKEKFGFESSIDFREGLLRTIAWYKAMPKKEASNSVR